MPTLADRKSLAYQARVAFRMGGFDRQGGKVGILPVGAGQKQQVVDDPAWLAVAEMLVRRL